MEIAKDVLVATMKMMICRKLNKSFLFFCYFNVAIVAKVSPRCVKNTESIAISSEDLSLEILQARKDIKLTKEQ